MSFCVLFKSIINLLFLLFYILYVCISQIPITLDITAIISNFVFLFVYFCKDIKYSTFVYIV